MANVSAQLETSRKALLDLSARNRLISTPRKAGKTKTIEIVDELATEVYRLLVKEGKALSFLPGREKQKNTEKEEVSSQIGDEDEDVGELPQPEDDETDERGVAKRHADHRLQTLLTSEGLQKRLLSLFYDAKTFEEEQGVNILYLAVGMLKWYEAPSSEDARYAPLLLIPVSLERGTAAERFKLRWRNEECATNLSLQAKMKAEFGLMLPELATDEDVDVAAYMKAVQVSVSGQNRFEVMENVMVLGFFSFAKFLMYRDLDPANWPETAKIDGHPLITGLMCEGFSSADGMIGEDENVDKHLSPANMLHVVDADSSQTLAIEEVRRGRNLVIQGPPGTGKSQTITNIIASAVAEGKTVLFVAEKMSALEVVYRRMAAIGLGPLCLELHSHKANKRAVLEELKQTRELGRPRALDSEHVLAKLTALRSKLNGHATVIHTPHDPSGLTPFQVIGHSVRLKQDGYDARGIVLDRPELWSFKEKCERDEVLADVTSRIREIGVPANHPWRGVCRQSFLPNEYDRFCEALVELRRLYNDASGNLETVSQAFCLTDTSLASLKQAVQAVAIAAKLPNLDCSCLADPVWENDVDLLGEIVQSGARYSELVEKLSGHVSDAAWTIDFTECRQQVALHGKSIFRILNSGYRQSLALLRSVSMSPLPKEQAKRIAFIDDIIAKQRLERSLLEWDEVGHKAFGGLWKRTRSNWSSLSALVNWRKDVPLASMANGFLLSCARSASTNEWPVLASTFDKTSQLFLSALSALFEGLHFDVKAGFGVTSLESINREELISRLNAWIDKTELLSKWISFKARYDLLCSLGLGAIAERLWHGQIETKNAQGVFDKAYHDVLTEAIFTKHPELRDFDGDEHNLMVANFRENDRLRIEQARGEVRGIHFQNMPKSEGGIGPLGILNGEFAKKRNHLPLRQLLKRTGPAIQALKPVFMMSPLSVAQFLEPGSIQFDLLVMDEASQVEPVDALGSIARAKQVVVVGDTCQLPPTRFFSRMTANVNDDDDGDENTTATQDVESVLNLCLARGLPQRMLRWHYRSKHQSLIAVSNRQFYDNRLFIVPSPYDAASGMGLKFHHLTDAVFDSGGTATNTVEAKTIAKAVIQHAKEHPNLSLGVGAFSVKQKQAIMDEIEVLRRSHPETEPFFTRANTDEPFFVKNLENIQGDERDVIFISVGYGRNQSGYMAMRFGPLSSEGGERRLNVLISRAKRRCEVFSSITADDIDLERAKGAGVAALKLFLKFAQTGKLDFGQATDREPDSVFEEQVAAALRSQGYDVKTQIGIAGFFVDLAVVDPEKPGRFVLGIECDGASYHSSRSARDRDRLRQAVLEDHGWIIHRIWSTDWFRRPKEQLEKTLTAIEQAKKTLALEEKGQGVTSKRHTFEIASHDEGDVVHLQVTVDEPSLCAPYQEASFPVPSHMEPHEVPDREMASFVSKIVEIEGPIHESEITARVRSLWGLARAGSRIQAKVSLALSLASRQGAIIRDGDYALNPKASIVVRDRSAAASPGLRKPENLPPHEIKEAILALVRENFGAAQHQIPTEVSRLLGFKATSAQLRDAIEEQIQVLLSEQKLRKADGLLVLG